MKTYERVLIVEDDEGVAFLQRQRLERAGYTVLTASNASEAVTQAKTGVDVVVLDYCLGNLTGLDVCEQFRAAGMEIPVVMVTGFSEESTVIKALRCGVRDFVPKTSHYLDYLPEAVDRVLKQKRTEKRLIDSESRLRQAQKMEALGQLAGGVAHEFNNLLQVIQGFTEGAIDELGDRPLVCEDLQEVLAASSKAATLTGQLLAFGRRQAMQMGTVDLTKVIEDLMKMLSPLLGQNIETRVSLDPELDSIWGCGTMVGQVVMNLSLNARDAMLGGGQLTIESSNVSLDRPMQFSHRSLEPGEYVRIQISDTGTGIAPEHLSRLYDPFFTTKPVGQGTGLGLATVFGIIEEHEGAIDVRSTLGHGTTFSIYLPRAASVADACPEGVEDSSGGEETILIAEDEAGVRHYLERILSRAGYQVLIAEDGEQALELFRRHQADVALLLLDMVMPKLPGRGVYQAVQAIRPGTRCVFISGYDPESEQLGGETAERLPVLQKPVRRQDLLRTIRHALDAQSLPPTDAAESAAAV